MKITKQQLKQIIEEELKEARLPAWERPGNVTPPEDVEILVRGYGVLMIGQIRNKLARMLQEAAEDAMKEPPSFANLNSGVIQALHQALKENDALLSDDDEIEEDKDWIQKAVDPEHEGDCTPMTKSTCTPARKALAKRFKKAAKKKEKKGGTGWQGKV